MSQQIFHIRWLQRDINKSNIIFRKFDFEFEFEFDFELELELELELEFDFELELELEFDFEFEVEFEFEFKFVPRIFTFVNMASDPAAMDS